ncbi:BTAD domain-containing putative transcriptional regulator [Streptomyces iconiensis]|uniref:BTAD domain-containing putative transcriptional regulator n=2 Tax=Streptomyces iconiensis TaxID=1384038 RepID=A0ABT7A6C7_9ACTN|nr:AfsR/SARP family transcriptional regulator [Streptomyces iconiensis]MDJ1136892.1 BTAD domain-containing putative transcriptional regulator [Streptomyces iconiensis]
MDGDSLRNASNHSPGIHINILGPLEVVKNSVALTPTAPKLQQVLGFLALHRQQVSQTGDLITEVWGESPPASAQSTLQTYIHKLRRAFTADGPYGIRSAPPCADEVIQTRPNGYVLTVPQERLDLGRFQRLTAEGQAALRRSEPAAATRLLSRALAAWRAPVLQGAPLGALSARRATALEETRLHVLELRFDAELQLGRYDSTINELKTLLAEHPLHESLHVRLILALHRCGRQKEALAVYDRLRDSLVEELGLDPSEELRRLQGDIIAARFPGASPGRATATVTGPTPAQLPPDVTDLRGRHRKLDLIERHVTGTGERGGVSSLPIVWVTGMPGVGKSALTLRAAHRVRRHFPDGQLFADLTGAPAAPRRPEDVLHGFLSALRVPPERIPAGLGERSQMFRTLTAGRRLLVLLHDAVSAAQVRPLLPGSGSCAVLVTSQVHGLHSAMVIPLEVLDIADGVDLLAGIVGRELVAREPRAAERLVTLCGGLPLALRAVAARVVATRRAARRGHVLSAMVWKMSDPRTRLSLLCFDDLDIGSRYQASFARLTPQEQHACLLLGLLPGGRFNREQASAQLGYAVGDIDALLMRLAESHFLRLRTSGCPRAETYYAFHQISRAYVQQYDTGPVLPLASGAAIERDTRELLHDG